MPLERLPGARECFPRASHTRYTMDQSATGVGTVTAASVVVAVVVVALTVKRVLGTASDPVGPIVPGGGVEWEAGEWGGRWRGGGGGLGKGRCVGGGGDAQGMEWKEEGSGGDEGPAASVK